MTAGAATTFSAAPAQSAPSEPPMSIPTNPKQYTGNAPLKSTAASAGQPQTATATLAMREASQQAAAKAKENKTAALKSPVADKSNDSKSEKEAEKGEAKGKAVPTELKNPPATPASPGIKSPSKIPLPMSPTSPTAGDVGISIEEQAGQPIKSTHRGSSISSASKEEIKKIENATAIPEDVEKSSEEEDDDEDEHEDDDDEDDSEEDESDDENPAPPNTAVEPKQPEPVFPKEAQLLSAVGGLEKKPNSLAPKEADDDQGEDSEDEEDEEEEEEDDDDGDDDDEEEEEKKKKPAAKTQTQSAKAAEKAGETVGD
jgi:hypothetical protein